MNYRIRLDEEGYYQIALFKTVSGRRMAEKAEKVSAALPPKELIPALTTVVSVARERLLNAQDRRSVAGSAT